MPRLLFIICWNPKEVGSNASEGRNLLVRVGARKQREQASFFHVLCIQATGRSMPQIKGASSHLRRSGLEVGLPSRMVVVHTLNPSTQAAEAGRISEFKASLIYKS